ncbi:hypothetical protein TeGR_g14332 [Tetraparma gracilis]|uniref:PX domain-containing protein n=1 Tax=Tetraparma gracilis TaxID=2962635 RepID=A0ABQ6NCI0_9STRA|nr:hypothetical protein TeGR_g14332 [Tetraparma gracilis]
MGPGGALLVGAAVGGMMGAAMSGPPPRRQHQTTTVIYSQPQPQVVYQQQPQVVYQHSAPPVVVQQTGYGYTHPPAPPPPQPFGISGLSISSFEERNGTVYYCVVVSSLDLGPDRPWCVWRRYKQFDELQDSTSKYVSTYKTFPGKSGFFNALVGAKHNNQELEVRRAGLEAWLREVVGKASGSGSRLRLQQILHVFLEYRNRMHLSQILAGGGGQGGGAGAPAGGGFTLPQQQPMMQQPGMQQPGMQQQQPVMQQQQMMQQQPPQMMQPQMAQAAVATAQVYQPEAEVNVQATLVKDDSGPNSQPQQQQQQAPPVFVPSAPTAPSAPPSF